MEAETKRLSGTHWQCKSTALNFIGIDAGLIACW